MGERGTPVRGVDWRTACSLLAALLLAGCASDYEAPIEQKPALPSAARPARATPPRANITSPLNIEQSTQAVHVVASGDKLLTIAWRYGLDVRDLVRWNQISNPDLIVVGQALRLRPPPPPPAPRASVAAPPSLTAAPASTSRAAPAANVPLSKPAPRISMAPMTAPAVSPSAATSMPASTPVPAPPANAASTPARAAVEQVDKGSDTTVASANNAAANKAGVRWMWPAQGKVSAADAGAVTKGIDIRGARGQAVKAAAGGTVVYSGSGLRGYGELIIIQHNDTFLSAYAHNEARLVQEGRHVDAGEMIARMGNTDTTDVMLHFEIRRNGKAVDPLQYLPNR